MSLLRCSNPQIASALHDAVRIGVNNFTTAVAQISGNQFYGLTGANVAAGANVQTGDSFLLSLPAIDSTSHSWSLSSGVTLESAGSTSLVQVDNNYFLNPGAGGAGPELKYNGSAVFAGEFPSSPIAAEQSGSGYDVAWKVPGADQYTAWSTDANGNYTSNLTGGYVSGSSSTFESLESVFHQDLNGDGFIGVKTAPIPSGVPIESLGSTSLVELGNHYFLNPVAGGSGPELKFYGSVVSHGQFANSPIAAEQTANGYEVAWKVPGGDLYTVWSTDTNGNFTSTLLGGVSGSSSSFESLESVFHQDLNGDGFVGVKTAPIPSGAPAPIPPSGAPIESLGSTSLVELGNHYFLNQVAGGSGPELKFNGSAVNDGQFASSPIAAEQTAKGYDVAWKVPGADLYSVWSTDANGNFTSNLLGGVSGSSSSFESLESVFHQDLNGDGITGVLNQFYGDAKLMSDSAKGGNDTLTGGNNTGAGTVTNNLFGDAESLSGSARGGNDTLIAGAAAPGAAVVNDMWGDGQLSGAAQGGADVFVFKDAGSMTVGTHNTIEDFSQSQNDKIEIANVAGIHSFADLVIAHSGTDTIITAGADQIHLHNFTGTLTAHDFLII